MIVIVIIFISYSVYNNYYRIDITNYRFSFLTHLIKSPDENHRMGITIYKENKESDTAYIMAGIHKLPDNEKDLGKTIFWQEVKSDTLKHMDKDGTIYDYWVDSETVSINGIQLNVNRNKYDYRRKLFQNKFNNQSH
ncbi:DUF5412 family protein [Tissierella praeacuta]|uniref:DUF5412 family protein n=1 Tax=Tissierella praeacuta TaxID=43131 RepID=UPI0035E4631B